jgi:hypothetical protein
MVNVIESDEGFSVKVLGRTGIEYREGDRSMFVDSEVLAVGNGMAVFKDSITGWKPPHNSEPINEEKKHEIVSNICRAVGSQGQHVDVL